MTCPVVGLGASAGGVEALTQLLSYLPVDTGLAFLVVQHLDPHQKSLLSEILARRTQMPVSEAADGAAVEHNHVYVIPPDTTMRIIEGRVVLAKRDQSRIAMPIDELFRSLACDCGANWRSALRHGV
jgi:two-component system, chemotaxis family, CheB/CheR fusion protein